MASQPQFGIACKTCRRRGRKCDQTLPKCMRCGVECEGYPLRWVGLAARGRMAVRTYQSVADDSAPRKQQASVSLISKNGDSNVGGEFSKWLNAQALEGQYYAHQNSRSATERCEEFTPFPFTASTYMDNACHSTPSRWPTGLHQIL